ncbi:DUF4179 domain-containing protein [[Clostridium] dakarense]|uniref:DUF4179 domain-containing protein n=1 Tax=Faecalimicrobium dakarense TaxID=1301100 RepID=UPI0004B932DA|nr:DUF4179 domain-containing protein [[Clostridium] dakarense]
MTKFDDIKIPHNIKDKTRKTIEKGRSLKKKKKFKYLKVASVAILLIGVCITTLHPSLANEIPNLDGFFENMSFTMKEKDKYTTYVQGVNLTKTVNDVSITIDEIVCDGHKIYFTYTIKSKNKLPRQKEEGFYKDHLLLDMKINVKNGTATEYSSSTNGYLDDYTYEGMNTYDLTFKGEKAPKVINLNILINNIYTNEPDSETVAENIEGPFNFKLKVSPNTWSKVINVNETKNGFTVDSLEVSPYSVTVNVRFPREFIFNKDKFKDPSIRLEYMYASGFGGKSYEDDINSKEYKIKNGMVYDSIVTDNHYGIGKYDITEYIIVKFLDLKDKSEDNVTEFKVYINK